MSKKIQSIEPNIADLANGWLKLTEIFVQLHISEKSGRGIPRIVGTYGESAFKFSNNAITVTIPYNRIDIDATPQVTPKSPPKLITEIIIIVNLMRRKRKFLIFV